MVLGQTLNRDTLHKILEIPGLGRSPGEGNSLPTPGFLPGGFHGQGSLVGYSAWGHHINNDIYTVMCKTDS